MGMKHHMASVAFGDFGQYAKWEQDLLVSLSQRVSYAVSRFINDEEFMVLMVCLLLSRLCFF